MSFEFDGFGCDVKVQPYYVECVENWDNDDDAVAAEVLNSKSSTRGEVRGPRDIQPYYVESAENWDNDDVTASDEVFNSKFSTRGEVKEQPYYVESAENWDDEDVTVATESFNSSTRDEWKSQLSTVESAECWDTCDEPSYNPSEYLQNNMILVPLMGYKMTKREKKAHYLQQRKKMAHLKKAAK